MHQSVQSGIIIIQEQQYSAAKCLHVPFDHNDLYLYSPTSIIQTLWPAPKSKCSDNRESVFDVRLMTPAPISYSVYHRLTKHFDISSHFWLRIIAHLRFILAFLTVVRMNRANHGCTALYCACAHRYCARHLYFDQNFCLAPKFG